MQPKRKVKPSEEFIRRELPPQAKPRKAKPRIIGVIPKKRVPETREKKAAAALAFKSGYNYFQSLSEKGGIRYKAFMKKNFSPIFENADFSKSEIKFFRGKEKKIWMMSALLPNQKGKPKEIILTLAVSDRETEMAASTKSGETMAFAYHGKNRLIYG